MNQARMNGEASVDGLEGRTTKRILDCSREDFARMEGSELLDSIKNSEGRTLMCEILCPSSPLVDGVSNEEIAVAFGADLILLNMFDGGDPREVKARLGRSVGVNVEPHASIPEYRRASRENIERLAGADFLVVTANPDAPVSVAEMADAASLVREVAPDTLVFAGKMHGSGGRGMVNTKDVSRLAAVSDGVLVPAPGTVPGSLETRVAELVDAAHEKGKLAIAAIGTSQEGSDEDTIREISLAAKRSGADVLHLGDAGVSGLAEPMNMISASLAIRGRRHTYRRMAMR